MSQSEKNLVSKNKMNPELVEFCERILIFCRGLQPVALVKKFLHFKKKL